MASRGGVAVAFRGRALGASALSTRPAGETVGRVERVCPSWAPVTRRYKVGQSEQDGGNAQAAITVDGCEVRITALTDGDGRPFALVTGVGCDLEGEAPGVYYPVDKRRVQLGEHETECGQLADDFSRAALALANAFEDAQGDGFAVEAADGWPDWLPSFDEAARALSGFGRDGFRIAEADTRTVAEYCSCGNGVDHGENCPRRLGRYVVDDLQAADPDALSAVAGITVETVDHADSMGLPRVAVSGPTRAAVLAYVRENWGDSDAVWFRDHVEGRVRQAWT